MTLFVVWIVLSVGLMLLGASANGCLGTLAGAGASLVLGVVLLIIGVADNGVDCSSFVDQQSEACQ